MSLLVSHSPQANERASICRCGRRYLHSKRLFVVIRSFNRTTRSVIFRDGVSLADLIQENASWDLSYCLEEETGVDVKF
jgi:hypothetical protein